MSIFDWKISGKLGSTAGIIAGIAISLAVGSWLCSEGSHDSLQGHFREFVPSWIASRNPKEVADPHLNWATDRCLSEVERPIEQIRRLFSEARSQSRNFAEEALGWDSKLTIVSDYFQQTTDHEGFLKRKFENLVISEVTLLTTIEQAIAQYQQVTASVEGEMLVRLRSDTGDFPNCPLASAEDGARIASLFQQAISQAETAAGTELQAMIGREAVSYVIGEIATYVGVQLGISSGIIGAGAASGWTNFGISVVVGLAVDQMVTAAYESYADPKGQLASQINQRLDEMERLIIDGSGEQSGLRSRLQDYARERSVLRETAVLQLLQTGEGGAL